jgi:hypothetical protein
MLPEGIKVGHYDDDGLKFDDKDRYGQGLTYTTPDQVRSLRNLDDINEWNKAVLAFVSALQPGARVVLYWC